MLQSTAVVRVLRRQGMVGRPCLSRTTSSTSKDDGRLVASTRQWLERIVVGDKLCPFASQLLLKKTVRIVAYASAKNEGQAVEAIKEQALNLMIRSQPSTSCDPQHETTLVVFDDPFVADFREFVRLSWTLQEDVVVQCGFQKELQLVLFHPLATHQTYNSNCSRCSSSSEELSSAADYTIRSPYPTIHLLREGDVMRAVTSGYPKLEELPERNKEKMQADGVVQRKRLLDECYVVA